MIVQRQEEMRVVEGAILTEMVALWANSDENVANVLTEITGRAFARTITWPSRNRLRHAFTLVVLESKEPAMRGAFGHFIHQLDTLIVNRMLADRRRAEHQDRMRRLQTLGGIAGEWQNGMAATCAGLREISFISVFSTTYGLSFSIQRRTPSS
jgi:hypothetical protein